MTPVQGQRCRNSTGCCRHVSPQTRFQSHVRTRGSHEKGLFIPKQMSMELLLGLILSFATKLHHLLYQKWSGNYHAVSPDHISSFLGGKSVCTFGIVGFIKILAKLYRYLSTIAHNMITEPNFTIFELFSVIPAL